MTELVEGQAYRVVQEGARLQWKEPTSYGTQRGKSHDLNVGDVIVYVGKIGSIAPDTVSYDGFELAPVGEEPETRGLFGPHHWEKQRRNTSDLSTD